jgi:TPR repeat protein
MCKRGDGWSCSKLGYNIQIWIGAGGTTGQAESEALLKIAAPLIARLCDRGDSASCHQLASQLFRGDGVIKNEDRAVTLAKKSCDLNDEDGCFRLATFHNVEGGDKQLFLDGLQRACDLKSGDACGGLALWYNYGTIGVFNGSDGSSKDLPRAWRLY